MRAWLLAGCPVDTDLTPPGTTTDCIAHRLALTAPMPPETPGSTDGPATGDDSAAGASSMSMLFVSLLAGRKLLRPRTVDAACDRLQHALHLLLCPLKALSKQKARAKLPATARHSARHAAGVVAARACLPDAAAWEKLRSNRFHAEYLDVVRSEEAHGRDASLPRLHARHENNSVSL